MSENNLLTNRPPVLGESVGIPVGIAKTELSGGIITLRFTQTGNNINSASPVMQLQTSYSLGQEYVIEGVIFTCALTCDTTSTSAIVAAVCFNTFGTAHRLTESSNTLVAVNAAINSTLNTTQGVTFPYGMRLPQGSRLELYAASPNVAANLFDVIATFYFRK